MNLKCVVMIVFLVIAVLPYTVQGGEQKVFLVNLVYDNGLITSEKIILTQGVYNKIPSPPEGRYKLEILSFNESVLYTELFDFELEIKIAPSPEWFDKNGTQIVIPDIEDTQTTLNHTTKEFIIPYYPNAKQINIYNPSGAKVLEIPVMQFADTCGNGVCEPQESYESCPSDCRSGGKDDYCDSVKDKICDPDCSAIEDVDCKTKGEITKKKILTIAGAVFAALIIAILLAYLKVKRSGKVDSI